VFFVASSVEVRKYKVADGVKMMKLQKKDEKLSKSH